MSKFDNFIRIPRLNPAVPIGAGTLLGAQTGALTGYLGSDGDDRLGSTLQGAAAGAGVGAGLGGASYLVHSGLTHMVERDIARKLEVLDRVVSDAEPVAEAARAGHTAAPKPTVEIPDPEPMLSPWDMDGKTAAMTNLDTMKIAAYQAGAAQACAQMGLEKTAIIGALAAGARAAAPMLGRMGTALRGARGAATGAAKAGWGAFAQAAPGTAKALGTAGKVLTHPVTQGAAMVAPMVGGK